MLPTYLGGTIKSFFVADDRRPFVSNHFFSGSFYVRQTVLGGSAHKFKNNKDLAKEVIPKENIFKLSVIPSLFFFLFSVSSKTVRFFYIQ